MKIFSLQKTSISITVPYLLTLKRKVMEHAITFSNEMNDPFENLKANLEYYFEFYLQPYFSCKEIKIAMWLDPRFKMSLETDKQNSKQILEEEFEIFFRKYPLSHEGKKEVNILEDDLEMLIENENVQVSEVNRYLNEPLIGIKEDPFKYWLGKSKNYPTLRRIAEMILCNPCTSIDVERLASDEGNIVTNKRGSLDPETVDIFAVGRHYLKNYSEIFLNILKN